MFKDGILYGVSGIDVFVNASDDAIIRHKAVDPNVGAIPLPCQERNVSHKIEPPLVQVFSISSSKIVGKEVGLTSVCCEHFEQVNLSQCIKAVDPSLKPLCEQDVYLDDRPADVYKKLLCCDTCAVQNFKKRDLLPVYLAVLGTSVFAIILMIIVVVLASKYRAARTYVREFQQGRAGSFTFLP